MFLSFFFWFSFFLWSVFCLAFVVAVCFLFLVGLFIENIWSSVFHSSSWENVADIAENQTDWKLRFSFQTVVLCVIWTAWKFDKFIILATKTYWENTILFKLKIIRNILATADQAISWSGNQLQLITVSADYCISWSGNFHITYPTFQNNISQSPFPS